MQRLRLLLLGLLPALPACVPYAVGTTAAVAPRDEVEPTMLFQFVPIAPDTAAFGGTRAAPFTIVDTEARFGMSDRTDLGVRLAGFTGIVASVKHRVAGAEPAGPGLALIGGAGVLNAGSNAHFEATLVASAGTDRLAVPYGGLRAMHTFPLVEGLEQDKPTFGAFLGLRIGRPDFGVSPEVGVFYDPSVTGLRSTDVVVVPSIALHGERLLRVLFGRPW